MASLLLVPLARPPVLVAAAMVDVQQLFDAAGTISEINQPVLVQSATPARLLGALLRACSLFGGRRC
jgi:hypothetical protein